MPARSYRTLWGLDVRLEPVLVGALFKETGNAPPGMVPKRGEAGLLDMARNRAFFDVPVRGPLRSFLTRDFNTSGCMRLLTAALSDPVRESCERYALLGFVATKGSDAHGAEAESPAAWEETGCSSRCEQGLCWDPRSTRRDDYAHVPRGRAFG